MAVMPGVDYRPIDYKGVKAMSRYDVVCVHTIVGNDPAPAAHFSVRGDGYITQSRDTAYRSAANYEGNHRVIAIENDDHGPEFGSWTGSDVPALTDAQCEANARIAAWAHKTHGIPLFACPDSRPESRGVAYHRQGIDGNWTGYAYGGRVSGGEHWSTSTGKVCPGDRRINQTINLIIPRARVLAGLEEDGMTAQNEAYIIDMLERLGNRVYSMLQLAEKVGDGPTKGEALPYVTSYLALAHRTEAYLRDMSPTTVGGPTAGEELKAVAALGTASQAAAPEIDYDQLAEKITAGILPHLQPGATPDQVKTIVRDALGDTHLTVQTGGIESR